MELDHDMQLWHTITQEWIYGFLGSFKNGIVVNNKETILRKSDYQQEVDEDLSIFSKLVYWKQVFEWKYSPIGFYFSFKKISQWKDI